LSPIFILSRGRGFGLEFFRIIGDILDCQLLEFLKDTIDGKFRANDLTEITIDAFPLLGDQGGVIPFFIELSGFLQDLVGAEFNAKTAAFAAVLDDVQFPDRNGMRTGIKR
jgi:hypothetical protein